jgi:hypothetical protein
LAAAAKVEQIRCHPGATAHRVRRLMAPPDLGQTFSATTSPAEEAEDSK